MKDYEKESMPIALRTPLTEEKVRKLRSGSFVLLTGKVYTARDAAHKRMIEELNQRKILPFDVRDQIIYYVGPSPAKPGEVIGSAGPTSSYRMDTYTLPLIREGLRGMIGKGDRGKAVVEEMKRHRATYFAAAGGAGALLSSRIKASKVIAYEDLGPEAIRQLEVVAFPMIVAIDSEGNNL